MSDNFSNDDFSNDNFANDDVLNDSLMNSHLIKLASQYHIYQHTCQLSEPLRQEKIVISGIPEALTTTPEDYLSISRLMDDVTKKRIYLNPADNYWLLEQIIAQAEKVLPPIDYIVCALQMPGCCRLSERLLAEDIFLVTDLTYDREMLLAEGFTVLCIENNLVRDPVENQSNHLSLSLYAKETAFDCWQNLVRVLASLGLHEVVK